MLADKLGADFKLEPPCSVYEHERIVDCANAKDNCFTWYLAVMDTNKYATKIPLSLVEGHSPLIIGLDVGRYSITEIMKLNKKINLKLPEDNNERSFNTYIAPDEEANEILRTELLPHEKPTASSMISNIAKRPALNLAKTIHRYTRATPEVMKSLFKNDGIINKNS